MRRRLLGPLAAVLATAAVISASPAPRAHARALEPTCKTSSCKSAERRWRHARRVYLRARAVRRRALAYDRMRWRTVEPYVGWLRVTGDCENGSYGGADLKSGLDAYNPSPFYGRYQFTLSTWASVGGHGDPRDADWLEQAYRAVLVRERDGTGAWPVCG